MSDLGNTSELEAELIKRNREIAKVRDALLTAEKRLEESQMRNDDLLEKVAELDSEVNTKATAISELEDKLQAIQAEAEKNAADADRIKQEHETKLKQALADMEQKELARAQDTTALDELNGRIKKLEDEKKELADLLEEEKNKHKVTRSTLDSNEASVKEMANKCLEQRKAMQQLEEDLAEREKMMTADQARHIEEERTKMQAELLRVHTLLEEHKGEKEDLQILHQDKEAALASLQKKMEDVQDAAKDHERTVQELSEARDEAIRKHEEAQNIHDQLLQAERKRHEQTFHKVQSEAASLDGKLSGQRMMMEALQQALSNSEEEAERLEEHLAAKSKDHEEASEAHNQALKQALAQAAQDAEMNTSRFKSELETEEVCARRQARVEIDAANRSLAEVEEQKRSLESQLASLRSDHDDASSQHGRLQDSLRNQALEIRQRLAEREEEVATCQQEIDKLKKDLEEAKLEQERVAMAHRLETERLQQSLEAEGQSRTSSEKIWQSKIEEKDTQLEHRASTIERLEQDLEDRKKKIEELEGHVSKAKEDCDTKAHQLGVRNAQLEGQLRQRQERVTEVEGRLEAQRQYLEQLNETLAQTQNDRHTLMETKGSLEAQLRLEQSHKDAVSGSLQEAQEESARRIKELEDRILSDREAHRETVEETKRAVSEELKQSSERLSAVEAELLTARQRCELLMRNKADLQQEVGQQREKHSTLEAAVREHAAEKEQLSLDLDQHRQTKSSLEQQVAQLQQEKREGDSKIVELNRQLREGEDLRSSQCDDFASKVAKLDELLNAERKLREETERSLFTSRQDAEDRSLQADQERRRKEQELQTSLDSWKAKAQEAEMQVEKLRDQVEGHKGRAEDVDIQRREVEAQLRGDLATAEARLRRLETEAQKAQTAVEEGKATLAQQHSTMSAKISGLERQLEQETSKTRGLTSKHQAADEQVKLQTEQKGQLNERLSMSAEELFTRQVEFALEKQRLSGALEESRRTLRSSLGIQNPHAAVDSIRLSGLEQQLTEERRKSIEQAVALQRAERRCGQLENQNKRSEEQRSDASQKAREAERRCSALSEDLRKATAKQKETSQHADELRERTCMSSAEIHTIRYEAKYEAAKLRGALDELRFMLKMTDSGGKKAGLLSTLPSFR